MKVFAASLAVSLASSALADVRFAAFGDYGNGPGANSVRDLVDAQAPDFVITVGDNCYGSSPTLASQVGSKYQRWVDARLFYAALGNHDYSELCGGGNNASGFVSYFTLPGNEHYYDYVKGPVHFFVVNSVTKPLASSTQGLWLKKLLAA